MAACTTEAADPGRLDPIEVARRFLDWYRSGPPDVGNQTGGPLGRARGPEDLARAAADYRRSRPDAAGNGSLMRTAPVALPHLGRPDRMAAAARGVSCLTHAHPLAGDACVLWCLAVDRAVRDGVFDLRSGVGGIPGERRDFWAGRIREAETRPPSGFNPNGYVVAALQAAWAAITQTPAPEDEPARHLQDTLKAAVRIGDDTDTVAAIAGALLGARWGAAAIPDEWVRRLHGRPGYRAHELIDLARRAAGLERAPHAGPERAPHAGPTPGDTHAG